MFKILPQIHDTFSKTVGAVGVLNVGENETLKLYKDGKKLK